MSRVLRISGYVALTIQMLWGLIQSLLIAPIGPEGLPAVAIGAHAHFGILSILAVVTGFAIERTDLTGTARQVAIWGFVLGQWLLPATVLMEGVAPPLMMLNFLWGFLLMVSMALLAWGTITADESSTGGL